MSFDMRDDIFARSPFGQAALKKMGKMPDDFRLYFAGWLGDSATMEVRGATFREAKKGPNKGKMCIKLPNSDRTVYVTRAEMAEFVPDLSLRKGSDGDFSSAAVAERWSRTL